MRPVPHALAGRRRAGEEHSGEVYVGKVNIDEEPELATRFGVMSIPTVMLFKGGVPVSTSVGLSQSMRWKLC